MRRAFWVGLALLFLFPTAPATADDNISVDLGFDGMYRLGRWNPVHFTVADPNGEKARRASAEMSVPQDLGYTLRFRQNITLQPQSQTFLMYTPLNMRLSDCRVTITDAEDGRRLMSTSFVDENRADMGYRSLESVNDDTLFLVCAGQGLGPFKKQITNSKLAGATQPISRLPLDAIGYDAVDALVLIDPPAGSIGPRRQQAIVDWVRSGGVLMIMATRDPIDPGSRIAQIMPCTIGAPTNIAMPADFDVPRSQSQVPGRELTPRPGIEPLKLRRLGWTFYRQRVGLGTIVVMPAAPPRTTRYNDDTSEMWRHIMSSAFDMGRVVEHRGYSNMSQQELAARREALDSLGATLRSVGNFDFNYVAIVLVALCLIVGPIDWLVLKIAGKQPWTRFTVTGWIGLVTFGAIYIGHVMQSGELEVRSTRLVHEADGVVVADRVLFAAYSPRSAYYPLKTQPDYWWATPQINEYFYDHGGTPLILNQRDDGARPPDQGMWIDVWHLRLLEAKRIGPAERGHLSANLTMRADKSLSGSITNTSNHTLRITAVEWPMCNRRMQIELAPGETHTLERLVSRSSWRDRRDEQQLDPPRTRMLHQHVKQHNTAFIDAEIVDAAGVATIPNAASELHRITIRSAFTMKEAP